MALLLSETKLRELLEKAFERGVGTGRSISGLKERGQPTDRVYDQNLELCVEGLVVEARQ